MKQWKAYAKNMVWVASVVGGVASARDVSGIKLRPIASEPIPGHGPGTPGGEGAFEQVAAPVSFQGTFRCASTDALNKKSLSFRMALTVPDEGIQEGLNATANAVTAEYAENGVLAENFSGDGIPVHFGRSAKGVYVELDANQAAQLRDGGGLKIQKGSITTTAGSHNRFVTNRGRFKLQCEFDGTPVEPKGPHQRPPVPGKK
jgi:hypothetical protein